MGFEYRVCIEKLNSAVFDLGIAVMKVYEDRYTAIISGACDSGKEVKEIKGSARKGSSKDSSKTYC